ncbi:MAG: WYL domain-containing protein [Anaerorhabdus sp.]|uniref:helix-turn-helix transcriptional regulator n=1 Tax=Anaerorhabdus sp. TaxID=1872524 RepID=UPI002FC80919
MNKKARILLLLDFFQHRTNEQHPVKMPMIIDYLESQGIQSERKAIYSDIETLKDWGLDILYSSKPPVGYFLASSDFDLVELKILIDAISSSDFLTKKKTESLNERLLSLTNCHDANELRKQILLNNKKFKNEQVFYSLDSLQTAIHNNMSIEFRYFDLTLKNEKKYRKDATYYLLIPYALIYENQRYYCVGYSTKHNSFSHYRVDKMDDLQQIEKIEKKRFNLQKYQSTNFNMSIGNIETITLQVDESIISTVIDSFGQDIIFQKLELGIYTVTIQTTSSLTFISWLLQFRTKIKVISPLSLVDEITSMLKDMLSYYTD